MPRPVTHVIFDLDGTLLDTEPLYLNAFRAVMSPFGIAYTDEMDTRMRGLPTTVVARSLIAETGIPLSVAEFIAHLEDELLVTYPSCQPTVGAVKLTAHLARHGIPFAIGTSSIGRQIEMKLTHHQEWLRSFWALVCADDVEHAKPSPEIFLEAARRMAAPPESCLVFEDAAPGIEAAHAAGMQAIALTVPVPVASLAAADHITNLAAFDPEPWGLPPYPALGRIS